MSDTRHTVDPRFTYRDKRTNKDVVLYQGLLDAAHRAGLMGTATEILQYPCAENDHTTIVRALITQDLGEGFSRTFSGIGDANPRNVGPNIAPHAIRMAETRAKARAFRDMLNVGMVTLEELGGEDAESLAHAEDKLAPVAQTSRRESTPETHQDGAQRTAAPAPAAAPLPVLDEARALVEAGKDVATVWGHISQQRKALTTEQWATVTKTWREDIKVAIEARDQAIDQRQPAGVAG